MIEQGIILPGTVHVMVQNGSDYAVVVFWIIMIIITGMTNAMSTYGIMIITHAHKYEGLVTESKF